MGDSNGQDMIVVIQSDDFDQSQGLIVVDPSQLQHMVTTTGAGGHLTGTTTTTTSNGEGEEMIVSDAHHGQGHNEYISLQMPDGSSQRGTLVLAHDGSENQGQEGNFFCILGGKYAERFFNTLMEKNMYNKGVFKNY